MDLMYCFLFKITQCWLTVGRSQGCIWTELPKLQRINSSKCRIDYFIYLFITNVDFLVLTIYRFYYFHFIFSTKFQLSYAQIHSFINISCQGWHKVTPRAFLCVVYTGISPLSTVIHQLAAMIVVEHKKFRSKSNRNNRQVAQTHA